MLYHGKSSLRELCTYNDDPSWDTVINLLGWKDLRKEEGEISFKPAQEED